MPDIILSSRNKPFTSRAYAEKNLPEGYIAVERDGGWVGVNKAVINYDLSDAERINIEHGESKEQKIDYSGKDVLCPGCCLSHHQTTEDYDPDKNANLSMLRLKDKYRSWGWEELPKDPHSGYGCLICPECGAALAPSGRLSIDETA